ncbi:hypothetical protein V8C86DRAFT_2515494 [Haematococcus lacustris]
MAGWLVAGWLRHAPYMLRTTNLYGAAERHATTFFIGCTPSLYTFIGCNCSGARGDTSRALTSLVYCFSLLLAAPGCSRLLLCNIPTELHATTFFVIPLPSFMQAHGDRLPHPWMYSLD